MNDDLKDRKQRHLEICLDTLFVVQSGSTGLDRIEVPHRSLPETDSRDVVLETPFPGFQLKLPLMISCMTGRSEKGRQLNGMPAEVAAEAGIDNKAGSIRVMRKHPETRTHFFLRAHVPDVPFPADIGAAQKGPDGVPRYISTIAQGIRAAGFLRGSKTFGAIRNVDLRIPEEMALQAEIPAEDALEAGGHL